MRLPSPARPAMGRLLGPRVALLAFGCLACGCLTLGCATHGPAHARSAPRERSGVPVPRRGDGVVTAAEIARIDGAGLATALDALARLRPEIVRHARALVPGIVGADPPVLYVDGTRQGSLALLADIQARGVDELRYYRPAEALAWFGPGHEGGVVAVRIRK